MKNAGRAAKYFERTFNYTPRETKLAKTDLFDSVTILRVLSGFSLRSLR
jgi:hypothetical protein